MYVFFSFLSNSTIGLDVQYSITSPNKISFSATHLHHCLTLALVCLTADIVAEGRMPTFASSLNCVGQVVLMIVFFILTAIYRGRKLAKKFIQKYV